jgi:hypothetical protein
MHHSLMSLNRRECASLALQRTIDRQTSEPGSCGRRHYQACTSLTGKLQVRLLLRTGSDHCLRTIAAIFPLSCRNLTAQSY